jgi:hypothetical protein
MDEAVIEESLIMGHTEVKKGTIGPDLLWSEDLVVVPFGIVVACHELVGLLMLQLFQVIFRCGLSVCSYEACIPQVLLGNIEFLPKLSVAMTEIAEESDSVGG